MDKGSITISLNFVDNRQVVEVFGREIVLSSILSKVENEISSNTDVEEIRFIVGTLFNIDTNLEKEIWRGRNIVVYAKEILVSQAVHWNVSGKDSSCKYEKNAGTGKDGIGLNGKDGGAGESGGNVTILAKLFKCCENLTITANGGKGSNGQDGGNGVPGKDGTGISCSDFDTMFPPAASINIKRDFNLCENFASIRKKKHTALREWIEFKSLIFSNSSSSGVLNRFFREYPIVGNPVFISNGCKLFYECMTDDGHKITFSYQSGVLLDMCQAFLLYEGTAGEPGKSGGQYGLGGEGGKPGEISVVCLEGNQPVNVNMFTKSGADGINGKGGVNGRDGKRGWDMAYLDYAIGRATGNWPKYYGRDKNSCLKLHYYSDSDDDRVYCAYKQEYAGISESRIENTNMVTAEERNNSRSNDEREHDAKAVGRKTISRQRILNAYSEFMNTVEAEIRAEQQKRAFEAQQAAQRAAQQAAQRAAQQAAEMELEQTIITNSVESSPNTIHRLSTAEEARPGSESVKEISHIHSPEEAQCSGSIVEIQNDESLEENVPSSEHSIEELRLATLKRHVPSQSVSEHEHRHAKVIVRALDKVGPILKTDKVFSVLDDWMKLNTEVIDAQNLQQLMDRFAAAQRNLLDKNSKENKAKIQLVEQMFLGKWKLIALQEIATNEIQDERSSIQTNTIEIKNVSKYLMETKEKNRTITHGVLGAMKQYLFENTPELRNTLATFVTEELKLDNIALHRAVKSFVLETEYSDLLNESAENLQNELKKPQHKNIYRFWDGMYDRPLENEVKAMIENDYTLKILYDRWNDVKRRISQYEQEPLSVTEDAKAKFIAYIRSKGVMAECCRELLAYAFNVNLRVYGRDEDDELILREDRNPSSRTQNHILARGKEFVQLTINEEYIQLAKERLHNDMNYWRILRDMDTLNSIKQINNYLDNGCIKPQGRFGMVEETHIDEKLATETIASYFPEEERNKLKVVLEKAAFEYSNQKRILQQMLQRFSYEGRDISFNEMCFFVNAVLENFDDCDQDEYTYAWIAAAYCQRNWVDEVILLQLETYFKKPLDETRQWREYMGKINNKEVLLVFVTELQACECSVECVDEILYLLSSVPIESMSFEGIALTEWSYFLKEHYWMVQLRHLADTCSLKWSKDESLEDATYYIRSVENIFGKYKANDLLDKIRAKKVKINAGQLFDILRNLYKQNWKLSDEDIRSLAKLSLQEWTVQMKAKHKPIVEELKIEQLTQIVENDEISSEEIINQLPEIRTAIQRISNKTISYDQKSVALFTEHEIKEWAKAFRSKVNRRIVQRHLQTYEQMLAVVDRAIEIRRGFRLRDTQRLSVLILLSNKRSTLAQVSTGEGKSLIVVALSLIKALFSEKVDIVTSSSVLAKRDSDVNKDIYQLFDIDVSHNCSENIEERKEAYSLHPVVYGDLANFQRDYLLDRFYGKNILGDRDFTNVLVDEVDSMLLDKGNNMLYLSHDIPGMDKLESLYICIWQMVNSSMERPEAIDIEAMEMDILSNLYNSITPDDLMELDAELGFRKLNIIWNCLVDGGIMNDEGHLITDNIDSAKMEQILTPEVVQYKHRLSFLLKECVNREKPFKVPNNLKKFVERHLSAWIASALNALLMVPGQSYVVSRNKSGAKDRNASIVILDNDTGADQGSSQWDEALHQFLQLKHGCKLSMQSLKAVFVSNVSYFKKYKLLYGLTGTLGSQRERNLLKDIHQVAFVTIPTAKSKQFKEYKPIISRGYRMWLRNIKTEVTKLINEENRSVLIICDTINNAEAICITLKETFGKNVHSYTRDYQEFDVVQGNQQLQQGQIIIATNLAGRGTDIRITDTLRQNGGLHVLLTYLPENIRIEEQAFGRAARSGDKGSGQLLIMVSSQRQYSRSKILELKKRRDQNELYRIAEIKTYYEKTIKAEEICFEEFKQVYEKHRKRLDAANVPAEVKTILLQTCLDRWAFWLDEYSGSMEDVMKDCNARKVPTLLMQLLSGINDFRTGELDNVEASSILDFNIESWKVWVEGNPMQMVKLANYITQTCFTKSVWQKVKSTVNPLNFLTEAKIRAAYKAAMSLYDEVIETEPQFSEAAYYYRAYTLMKTVEHEETTQSKANKQRIKDFKQDLRAAKKLFEDHYAFALQAASIVSKLRRNQDWYDDYQKQNDTISQFYQTFIRSIEDILGHAVTASTFVNDEIKEELAEFIFIQLIEAGTLRSPKVRKTISEKQLYTIQSDYCISINALRQFLLAKAGPIDEEDFLKECSVEIPLASRERFWESLITQNVLNCIQKYAIIDNVKLAKVDPSLKAALDAKVTDKTLIVESITPAADQIVLYYEELSLVNIEPSKDDPKSPKVYIFEKDNFIRLIGGERFVSLAKKGIIRCNEIATVDKNKIASCRFSLFDSISVKDIVSKANIAEVEAKLIIDELISQQVLERKDECFALKEGFSVSQYKLLPSYPLYESTVRGVLTSCFAFRFALNNLMGQLKEDSSSGKQPLRIQLQCNIYPQLFQDLIHQNIVKPFRIKTADYKSSLNGILSQNKCFDEVNVWFQRLWHISRADSIRLFDHVFITPLDMIEDYYGNCTRDITKGRTQLLVRNSFTSFYPNHQAEELINYNMAESIQQFCSQLDVLYKKETRTHVESVLGQMKPSLVGLQVPSVNLKSIQEVGKLLEKNFGTIEEELLFTLNGLQYRLHLQEKKWSKMMLFSVGVVVGIGIAQIITAAVMEIYSAGAFTHVASGLINEGINDIMYAVNSFKSGYFSWKDYGIEKIKNVVLSGITVGVGAYASRGTKVSRIGKKVAGPGLIEDAKELSTLTGAALKKSRAGDKIFGETMKRIVCKTAQGFAQGAASAMVDTFTDDYLQSVINSIAGEVLAAAVSQVDGDKLSQTLRRIYDELGEQQARKLILQLSDFESNGWETSISYMKQFKSSLAQGFANAMKKTGNNSKPFQYLSHISTVCVWAERANEVRKIVSEVYTFISNLDNKLNEKCKTMTRDPSLHEQQNANDFETFRHEIVSQWKKQLGDCVGRMITQHFVKPLLNDALIRAGKFATRIPHNVKRIALNRKMKKLKKKYDKAVNDPSATDAIKDSLKKDYHTKLEKIMYKTKSPALFAKIIEENVKMDLTCAAACAPLVHALMKQMGIKVNGIVLNVQLENGAEQSFSSGSPEGADVRQVVLHLKGNHFTFSGNDQDVANNNCMFAAMCDAIPELSVIDADKFRKQIANTIRHEPDVQHRIRQGWHRFPIKHYNAIGGKQITMPRKDAPQRAYHNDSVKAFRANLINYQASENFKQSESPSFHLVSRVSITSFEIAGAISAIMEVTGLEFEDIIDMEKGSSTTKDDIPVVKGNEIQRAHTTRGTIKSGGKFDKYPELKTKLQHYFAHREYVVKEANQYKRVAGSIDDNQMEWVREIIKDHTFSKPPSHNTVSNIQTHLLKTKTVVNKRFTKGKKPYSELMVSEMEVFDKSISKVAESEVDCKTIYESGQFGYSTIMEGVNKAPNVYVRKSKSNSEQKKKKKML